MCEKRKSEKEIMNLYSEKTLDKDMVWHKTKTLLSIYRKVVWIVKKRADEVKASEVDTYGKDLDAALCFLDEFAPEEKKKDFEHKVCSLFESKWLIDLVDEAISHIHEFPEYGEVYEKILLANYIQENREKDIVVMTKLNMSKTLYYQRKKEATLLMGVALWGYAIPEFRKEILLCKEAKADYGDDE